VARHAKVHLSPLQSTRLTVPSIAEAPPTRIDSPVVGGYKRHPMITDASLRFRMPKDLHQQFLTVCQAQDKPAAQVLREFMRSYVKKNQDLLEEETSDDRDEAIRTR
jgi:hypothetical protein